MWGILYVVSYENKQYGYGDFGNLADNYSASRAEFPNEILSFIFGRFHSNPNNSINRVLDLGCGTGISSRQISRCSPGLLVCGCDSDPEMLLRAVSTSGRNVSYCLGSAENIPFNEDTYDVVTAFSAFHWFDIPRALVESERVLKNRGLLAVINKNAKDSTERSFRKIVQKFCKSELPNAKASFSPRDQILGGLFCEVSEKRIVVEEELKFQQAMMYYQSKSLWNLIPSSERASATNELRDWLLKRCRPGGSVSRVIEVVAILGEKRG